MPEFITTVEKTSVFKSFHGWQGETFLKINGLAYEITTMKRSNGEITSTAQKIASNKIENGFRVVSFMMFQDKNITILREKAMGTEAKIKELHYKALALIDTMQDKFPKAGQYKIEPGQVIFVDWIQREPDYKVIYKIEGEWAYTVNTKTLALEGDELHMIRPYSQKFGIGTYYNENDRIDMDTVFNLVIDAKAKEKQTEEDRPAKEAEAKAHLERATAEIEAKYPHLVKSTNRHGGVHVAVNVRIELKREFPNVKFSVRSEYSSVNVDWEDGPSRDQVEAFTAKWQDHHSDYTGDYWDPSPTLFNDIFGGVKFMFENRKMSDHTSLRLHEWADTYLSPFEKEINGFQGNGVWKFFSANAIPVGEWEIIKDPEVDYNFKIVPVIATSAPTPIIARRDDEAISLSLTLSGITVTHNTEKNGIEIRFPARPSDTIIADLKAHGFRWSGFGKCWWVKFTESQWQYAAPLTIR